MKKLNSKDAISFINKNGMLLTFPVNNKKEPLSLWSQFFPRTAMRWEWDESGDNRVGEMWSLMKKLSDCKEVVYSKWYQNRATFISRKLFVAMMRDLQIPLLGHSSLFAQNFSPTARLLLETLESDSPLSTKELKKLTELRGKENESRYTRAMKELFASLLIVAFGEVDDGAFPSLAIGATQSLYEDLWIEAQKMSPEEARYIINSSLKIGNPFRIFYERQKRTLRPHLESLALSRED